MAERLRYEVDVNTRDGVRELKRLGDAGKDAGKDLEAGMDDAASASKAALAALTQMTDKMETELQGTAQAVKALGDAFGTGFDQAVGERMVADLRRMGVTFEDIEADAKEFVDVMQRVDGIKLNAVNSGLTDVDGKMRQLGSTSDQSRSVLANLAGNSAQDLGELGGVVGSLGVGVGQLAEYAVDGNIAMSNLAKVAGPMAGLSAAMLLVQHVMDGIAKRKAFEKKEVEDYTEAIVELGEGSNAVLSHFEELGKVQYAADSGVLGFGTTIKDVTGLLDKYGITAGEVARVVAGTEEEQRAWFDALAASGLEASDLAQIMAAMAAAIDSYQTGVDRAGLTSRVFTTDLGHMNDALAGLADPMKTLPGHWDALIQDVADGTFDFENAATALDQLAEATGLTTDEIIEMVKTKADEYAADFAAAVTDAAVALDQARDNAAEFNRITSGAAWDTAAVEGATTAYETFRQAVTGDRQRVAESEAAWDGLGEAVEGAGDDLLNLQSPEGRQVFEALDELGTSIVPDLAKAFDDSDGDINVFRRSADTLANQTMRKLQDEFGVSQDEARLMIAELGLLPEQVTTFYELAGDEEARVKLGLLQGVIDLLPASVQTEVAMHIINDDPQAALAAIDRAVSGGVDTPLHLNTAPAMHDFWRFQAALSAAGVVAGLRLNTSSASSQAAAAGVPVAATSTTAAAPVPAATGGGVSTVAFTAPAPKQFNVTINAAVIGNRADVQRAVTRALRNAERLGAA